MQRAPDICNTPLTVTIQGETKDTTNSTVLSPSPVVRVKKKIAEASTGTGHLDELDLILCHEEFPSLVSLSKKVKNLHQMLKRGAPEALIYYEQNVPATPKSALTSKEVMAFVMRLREHLSTPTLVIRRGAYPVTDASLDDNIAILQREVEYCESCIRKAVSLVTAPAESTAALSCSTKYAKWQSDILFRWLVDNHKAPKLHREACLDLASRTGLTPHQVSTWLQNMRRRRQTNTVKGTKKAAHFLDYLFLAHERDQTQISMAKTETTNTDNDTRLYASSQNNIASALSLLPANHGQGSQNHPFPPPHAVTESFEDPDAMDIEPINLLEYEINCTKQEESEMLRVFAQAWYHEALAVAAALPPPPQECRDDEEYDDFAMELMSDDVSPFDSGIFRKRAMGDEDVTEDHCEVTMTAV